MTELNIQIHKISEAMDQLQNMLYMYNDAREPAPDLQGNGETYETIAEIIEIQKGIENEFFLLVDNTVQFLLETSAEFQEEERKLSGEILVVTLDN